MRQSIDVYRNDISARLMSGCLTFLAAPFIFVLDAFAKSIVGFVMSVCLSVHVEKKSAPTGQIFMKFRI